MSKIDTGGAAFPTNMGADGMTLRDWFAGKLSSSIYDACREDMKAVVARAIDGLSMDEVLVLVETPEFKALEVQCSQRCARLTYELADAMIAEKRRTEEA